MRLKLLLINSVVVVLICFGQLSALAAVDADLWQKYNQDGESALGQNMYGDAEKNLTLALKEAEKIPGPDLKLATTLKDLADLYQVRGQPAKAESYYERSEKVREKVLGAEDPEVIASVVKLAQFYLSRGNNARADRICGKLVQFADMRYKDDGQIQCGFDTLNKVLGSHAYLKQASDLIKQAQATAKTAVSTQAIELAAGMETLGTIYKGQGKFANAEPLYKRSLMLREKTLTAKHLAIAQSCTNLADLYSQEKKYSDAEPLYARAVSIAQSAPDPQTAQVVPRLNDLSHCYFNMGRLADAESTLRSAVLALESAHKENVTTLVSLAELYTREGKYSQAEALFKRAITATEKINGKNHCALLPIIDSYVELLQKMNRSGEANKLAARGRTIRG